jgi:hypothetical protein
MKADDPDFEAAKNLMAARLAEEIVDVGEEYELFLREHVENTRAARLAATAPSHAQWAAIIRQQNALHRQLERKIRLLEEMQEKRKKEEERFLDNYQASLRQNPSGGTHGGGHGPELTRSASLQAGTCRPKGRRYPENEGVAQSGSMAATKCVGASGAGPGPNAHRRQSGFGVSATALRPKAFGRRAVRPYKMRKKILNRGNELKDLLQAKGLAAITSSKRTPFCTQKVAIEAEKSGISVPKKAALPPDLRKASEAVKFLPIRSHSAPLWGDSHRSLRMS